MTFKVYGEIEIDGKAARVEIKGVDDALEKAARGADKFSFSGKGAAGGMGKLKGETTLAAGSVANLGAQFNDIGVMLAAGQNPLQLAIQQGTQITQVFGNAGAAARVGMLKQAFLSVISPANLLTIGVIAGAAALAQWGIGAASAGEKADELGKRIEAVDERQKSLNEELRRMRLGVSAEELTLMDGIAAARREILILEEEIGDTQDINNMHAVAALAEQRTNLADLMEQLQALRWQQTARERLVAATGELADQERLLGEQMRDVGQEAAETENIVALLKDGIKASTIEAMALAGVDLASPISAAAQDAALLAQNLGIAYAQAVALQYARTTDRYSGRGGDPRQFDSENRLGGQFVPSPDVVKAADDLLRPTRTGGGRRGGRGGASEAERERDAVEDLVRSLTEQRDILRETDPVQKEMIRNRETLKAATDAEKQSVEQLIATRIAEEAAIERATEQSEFFKDSTYDALEGLILRGERGADVIANLADALAQAALQSALLGEGPLAGLFGMGDSGGLLGIIGGALFPGADVPGNADGGMQYGPGGPRDDRKHVRVSPGEFIVNAQSTAQNRALLEYINGGGLVSREGFANGGMPMPVAMPAAQSGGFGGGMGRMVVQIMPSELFEARVIEASQGVFAEGMNEYRSQGLPGDMERISLDPGRRG
ncbi:phage tail length tape measure family protein [Marivita sp.]|uniref:phage tail length tape measure family protein n=1 Tax=Marivita sp. TaxID=2003365 RepID=UPI003F723AF2